MNVRLQVNFKLTLFSLCGKWTFSISVKYQFVLSNRKHVVRHWRYSGVENQRISDGFQPHCKKYFTKNLPIIVIAESEVAVSDKATVFRMSKSDIFFLNTIFSGHPNWNGCKLLTTERIICIVFILSIDPGKVTTNNCAKTKPLL